MDDNDTTRGSEESPDQPSGGNLGEGQHAGAEVSSGAGQQPIDEAAGPLTPRPLGRLAESAELVSASEYHTLARQAEAATLNDLLDYKDRRMAQRRAENLISSAQAARAIHREIAYLLGISDLTAASLMDLTGYSRTYLPTTWDAFSQGLIDVPRLRVIANACIELDDEDTRAAVEAAAAKKAATAATTGVLKNWVARYMATIDDAAFERLHTQALPARSVEITHLPNGMSSLYALLPTVEAAAIEKRLRITARKYHQSAKELAAEQAQRDEAADDQHSCQGGCPAPCQGPCQGACAGGCEGMCDIAGLAGNEALRLRQREADLFSAWLRTNPTGQPEPTGAKIMIMVPEATLTGDSDQPAMAADRSWMLPASQARNLAQTPGAKHQWYAGQTRPNEDEASVDILTVTYHGYSPPDRLRDAIIFRDGHCQATGCTTPAERSDIDHQRPWQSGGETTGSNLCALCRRHHQLKSHGHPLDPAEAAPS